MYSHSKACTHFSDESGGIQKIVVKVVVFDLDIFIYRKTNTNKWIENNLNLSQQAMAFDLNADVEPLPNEMGDHFNYGEILKHHTLM